MSEDMLSLARSYAGIRDAAFPGSAYFFPAPDGGPYSAQKIQGKFKWFFARTKPGIPKDLLPAVRVYDLRHRFATAVLNRWLDEKKELSSRLPYLQTYMGHKDWEATAYYIHLLPEKLVKSAGIDWEAMNSSDSEGRAMGKVKDEQLFSLLRDFLLIYLPNQRHASSNTVKAYRTAWNQLLKYIAEQKKISLMSVTFEMICYEMVVAYLDWLSEEKGIGPATRNNRLAAIRAFITYASACRPEYISLSSELAAIKIQKKERFREVDYMSEDAVKALLAAPDTRTKMGLRDQFLMIFLYDTGARIQEALDVKICDLRIDKTPTGDAPWEGRQDPGSPPDERYGTASA